MNRKALNEQALIKACRKNKRLAQKQLYEQHYVVMMRVCQRYVQNKEDAVDVLNQGFFKAFTKISQFNEAKGSFKNWLMGIMVRTAIDHYRKVQKFSNNVDIEYAVNEPIDAISIENISAEEILSFIQKLSPQYQLIFNLSVIEGYTHKEIGEQLNISAGTSKSNLFKAKSKLREMINEANQYSTLKKVK